MKIGLTRQDKVFHAVNHFLWVIVFVVILYPLYLIIISSVSDPFAVLRGEVILLPVGFSLAGYRALLQFTQLWRSYANSIFYTVTGTMISVVITLMGAYATSRPFPGKGIVNFFIIFTMFFSGGLIPTFLMMGNIGLHDNPLILIIMGAVSVWNLMVARAFINITIPNELYEASVLDGATHIQYFTRIVMPLSGTIVAVLCVYYGVARWNDFFTGMIYIRTQSLLPLQTVMRSILATLTVVDNDLIAAMSDHHADIAEAMRMAEIAKYCIIVVSTVPAVVLYVFMQKYFVKGVMIGSIKG